MNEVRKSSMRMHILYYTAQHNPGTTDGEWHEYDVGIEELQKICSYGEGVQVVSWGKFIGSKFRALRQRAQRMIERTWCNDQAAHF